MAGDSITFFSEQTVVPKYKLGDAISASFPQSGTFPDWGYGAGWDKSGAIDKCETQTTPSLPEDFYSRSNSTNVRTAFFLVETSEKEVDPPKFLYGARDIEYKEGGE